MNFYNKAEDVKWVKETHLKNQKKYKFKSFIIHGNEDCPLKLALYEKKNPLHTERPIALFTCVTGDLVELDINSKFEQESIDNSPIL